jgi:hypothetical protein
MASIMSEQQTVLYANALFYSVFMDDDIAAMEEMWAQRVCVSCVHPGWNPIIGRHEVMASWRPVLAEPAIRDLRAHNPVAKVLGRTAVVHCNEVLPYVDLLATNIFVRGAEGWKLVHHQSALGPRPVENPGDTFTLRQ